MLIIYLVAILTPSYWDCSSSSMSEADTKVTGNATTAGNCEKLQIGQSRRQVSQLFQTKGEIIWDNRNTPRPMLGGNRDQLLVRWKGKKVAVAIWFDKNDCLKEAIWQMIPDDGKLHWTKATPKGK